MKNVYYTALSRDNFIRLYRYGNIKIIKSFIFLDNEGLKFNLISLLKDMQCEHDEDYVILKFFDIARNDHYSQILYNLEIQDIQQIYVLSKRAQGYYKPKFNPKLQFAIYPDNILDILNRSNELDDMGKGIDVFVKQFDFMDRDKIERELPSELKKKFLEENNVLSKEFESFYIDLLFYDRKNFFPKESIGYIFDIIIITALMGRSKELISKFMQGQLKIETSSSYKKLNANKKDTLFEYIKFIEGSDDEEIKKFVAKVGNINYLIIGAIFLMIKNILQEKHKNYREEMLHVVDSFSSEYKEQLSKALYLIGFTFGYKEFYEDYYDSLDLSIFKELHINKEVTDAELKEQVKQLKNENEILKKKENTQMFLGTEIISGEGSLLEDSEIKSLEDTSIQGDNKKVENKPEAILENNTSNSNENNEQLNINNLAHNESIEVEFHSLDFIPNDILSLTMMSITDLKKLAKDKGVDKPTSKKYSNDEKGKTALINQILKKDKEKLLLSDNDDNEDQASEVEKLDDN